MDLPKLFLKPKNFQNTFLTDAVNAVEQQKIAITERRREFVKEMLSKAAEMSQKVVDRDLNSLIETEIQAGVVGMQKWMDAKVRMTENKLKKIEKEADKSWYGEENLAMVGEIRKEMEWLKGRITELELMVDGFMRKKQHLDQRKRDSRKDVTRLKNYLKQITVQNIQLYSEAGVSPFPSQSAPALPKRASVTPEPGPLLRSTEVSTVSRLKETLKDTQRSVSLLKSKVRETRDHSPAAVPKVSECERFFRECLSLYRAKQSATPPRHFLDISHFRDRPLLRSKSSVRVPPSTASPLKSTLLRTSVNRHHTEADMLQSIAGNQRSVALLAYFTFHKAL